MSNYKNSYINTILLTSLIELLEKTSIRDISISALTRKAQISRSTFYRHYSSIEDFLVSYLKFLIDDFNTNQNFDNKNIISFIYNLCQHCCKHKSFYKMIFYQDISFIIISVIKEDLKNFFPSNTKIDSFRLNAFAYGLYGWLEGRIQDGMSLTPDEILQLLQQHKLSNFYKH